MSSVRIKHRTIAMSLAGICLLLPLAACGSSSDNGDSAQQETNQNEESDDKTSNDESSKNSPTGTGSVTVDGNSYTFDLICARDEETLREDVSLSISGTNDSEIEMAFTQMWGLDMATQKLSPNAPPSHTLNIYSMPGAKGLYEYLSMSGGAVTVTDKTVKGTVKFFKIAADGSSETFQPTLEGNIDLQCP